jgi:uncharacterized protein YjiS (DUF1127 family)
MFQVVMTVSDWLDFSGLASLFKSKADKIDYRLSARKTYKELSKLSDYELRDIGLTRGDIHAVAYEAYYDDLMKETKAFKKF